MRLSVLGSKMGREGFTLVEVMVSLVIFTFVAVVVLKSSNSSQYLTEQSNKKKETINLMSVTLLNSLGADKDEKRAAEFLVDIKLDDKIKKVLKDKKIKYEKKTIVPAVDSMPSLVQISFLYQNQSSYIYQYE